jgi:tetratricopeptide (TPR) repeat protein
MVENQDTLAELNLLVIRLYQQGKYKEALRIAHQSAHLTKDTFGGDYPDYAESLNNLALMYDSLGVYEKAEPLYLQVLQIRQKAWGDDQP